VSADALPAVDPGAARERTPRNRSAPSVVEATGGFAAIGALEDAVAMREGHAGTLVRPAVQQP
jgi:hypothetical protein